MNFTTKAQAEAAIAAARQYIDAVEVLERRITNARYVGNFYRTRTNYSCPQKPTDYWWIYVAVTGMDADGFLSGWRFARDKDGKVEIEPIVERLYPHIYLRCKVSRHMFEREYAKVLKAAKSLGLRASGHKGVPAC